jgi:hypothetical protein
VALVASGRFSQRAVQNMDDLDVLSIATGQPRIGAIVGSEGEPLLGDAATILQARTLFAPNGYNTILEQTLPATGAGTAAETVSGNDAEAGKKPAGKARRDPYRNTKAVVAGVVGAGKAIAGAGEAIVETTKDFYSGKAFGGDEEE